jgi:hypothetical protein
LGETRLNIWSLALKVKCKTWVARSSKGALGARTARSSGEIERLGTVSNDGNFVVVLHVTTNTWSISDDRDLQSLGVCSWSNAAE